MTETKRNDPCHCGSGQKYKKCCWAKDEAARTTELAAQAVARAEEAKSEKNAAPPSTRKVAQQAVHAPKSPIPTATKQMNRRKV